MSELNEVRLDKWLWAARFFKTRSLAAAEVGSGHVTVNQNRAKPARVIRTGDQLDIRMGTSMVTVLVLALSERRGPATQARTLYEETAESLERREQERLAREFAQPHLNRPDHRPDKHERRNIRKFLQKE